jgi:integrase
MKGWRKVMPALPRLIMFGLAMDLLARGRRAMALMTVLAFACYLRPGEALDLKGKNVVAPVLQAGKQFKWVTIVVREAEGKKPDKTGVYDNSIPIDKVQLQWLGRELLNVKKGLNSTEDLLFTFTMEEFRVEFARSGKKLNLEVLHPYQLRHGGATDDLSSRCRDHNGVKSRGRWRTDSSVRRYAKIGKVQELLTRLGPQQISYCKWAETSLVKCFQGQVPPRLA